MNIIEKIDRILNESSIRFTDAWIKKGGRRLIIVMGETDKSKVMKAFESGLEKVGLDPAMATAKKYKKSGIDGVEIGYIDYMFDSLSREERNELHATITSELNK